MSKILSNELSRVLRRYEDESSKRVERSFTKTMEYRCHTNDPNARKKERDITRIMSKINLMRYNMRKQASLVRGLVDLQT